MILLYAHDLSHNHMRSLAKEKLVFRLMYIPNLADFEAYSNCIVN